MLPFTYELSPTDLFENGKTAAWVALNADDAGYYNVGTGARWKWTTVARRMEVDSFATLARNIAVRVTVGGTCRDYYFAALPTGQVSTSRLWLPAGSKTVELIVPGQHASSAGGAPAGVYPMRVRFDASAAKIAPNNPAKRVVIYGDSITAGGNAICEANLGFAGLMKRSATHSGYDGRVTLVAHGFRRLADDCSTSADRTAFVTALLALSPTIIVLFIGSNDQAVVPEVSNANFTTYYTGLLDEIRAQSATVKILCASPLLRGNGSEVANSLSETMTQKRTIISDAVTARAAWAVPPVYRDGSTIIGFSDLDDGVHPKTTAHPTIRDSIQTALAAM